METPFLGQLSHSPGTRHGLTSEHFCGAAGLDMAHFWSRVKVLAWVTLILLGLSAGTCSELLRLLIQFLGRGCRHI